MPVFHVVRREHPLVDTSVLEFTGLSLEILSLLILFIIILGILNMRELLPPAPKFLVDLFEPFGDFLGLPLIPEHLHEILILL
jgi:hypothetical protein